MRSARPAVAVRRLLKVVVAATFNRCTFVHRSWGPERRRGHVMINWRDGIRAMKCGLLAVFLLITVSSTSQAGPLGVVIEPIPSLIAGLITSTYNATTGAFTS